MTRGRAGPERVIGRYALFDRIASGGMATVHLGRMMGPAGWSRVVAIKRMLPRYARDREFVRMFLDEARLTTRVRHPHVVSATDVVAEDGELFLVMDYVEGESLASLLGLGTPRAARAPVAVAVAVMIQALHGLHAAHEAKRESGEPIGLVHRDVSPQNILVGVDGLARVVDFGIAKAAGGEQTRGGVLKGKAAYMAPEQIRVERIDRRVDVYAASVVLWEALTGRRLFVADTSPKMFDAILKAGPRPLASSHAPDVPPRLDAIVAKGLAGRPDERFATALEMAEALESAVVPASPRAVGKWVESIARETLSERAARVAACEGAASPARASEPDLDDTVSEGASVRRDEARPALGPAPLAKLEPAPIDETRPVIRPTPGAPPARPSPPTERPLPAPPLASSAALPDTAPVLARPTLDTPSAPAIAASTERARSTDLARSDLTRSDLTRSDLTRSEHLGPPAPEPTGAADLSDRVARSRRLFLVVAVVSAALFFSVGALYLATRARPRAAGAPSAERLPPILRARAVLDAPPTAMSSSAVAPDASLSPPVDVEPSAEPSPSASGRALVTKGPSRSRCRPPFYYEDGIKKFKPGCL